MAPHSDGNVLNEQAAPVEIVADLVYSTPMGKPLLLDLYLPQGFERPLPVILWLHGGGWRIGNRRLAPDLSRYFAARGSSWRALTIV